VGDLRSCFDRLQQRIRSRRRIIFGVGRFGRKESEPFTLSEDPKYLGRLLIDDFDGPDIFCPQRYID
jgi:hypothetical protein